MERVSVSSQNRWEKKGERQVRRESIARKDSKGRDSITTVIHLALPAAVSSA